MANINEILARAAALRDETALNSISPERAGGIMYDTLLALNELWLQQGSALVISKIYASVAAMEADSAPVSDLTGQPLRPGQIVVIASSDSDNGSVYRYNGIVNNASSWTLVGAIGNLDPVDSLDSDSTTLPLAAHQGKVLDGKINQLGQELTGSVMTDWSIVNGSQGNAANTWVVTICGGQTVAIPVEPNHKYKVVINKPTVEGYNYYFRINTYSKADVANLFNDSIVRNEVNNWNHYYENGGVIETGDNERGLSIQLTELTAPGAAQATDTCIALRNSDFAEGDIIITDITNALNERVGNLENAVAAIDTEVEEVCRKVDSLWDYNGKIVLYNGSNGNPNNPNVVRSCVIPTNGAKYVTIKINRPNATGCHYAFGYALTSDTRDIGSTLQTASWYGRIYVVNINGNQTDAVIDISSFPTAVGVAITVGEYDANNTIQTRRITDYDGYDVCVECSPLLEELVNKEITTITSGGVVERNKEREIPLEAMCRYRKTSSPIKDVQFCICTDSHADALAVNNAVDATNGFNTIDGFIHCGDITASYYETGQVSSFQNSISRLTKPGYIVVGNHDVGNAYYVGICCDHAQAYAAYIKPMVDKGWLVSGEYTENKPYWYHDLPDYKIRLIGLYEYDDNLDFNETYWRAIAYNSGLSNIAMNMAYSSGAQVNVPGYTAHSFEAVQNVTTPANYYTNPDRLPSYKVRRGNRVIRQEQAQWYLNTLLATPTNYGVVVILHNPFADDAEVMDVKFSQIKSGVYGAAYSQNDMATDLIGGALAAFATGSNYSENIAMKRDAAYMNTQGGGTYAYSVSKNFASKNIGVKVFGLIGGHSHRDLVWEKGDLIQVTPICATTSIENATSGDIRRADTDGLTKDSLTVVSFAAQRIGLVKIGVNVTDTGYARDFEVIPVNN